MLDVDFFMLIAGERCIQSCEYLLFQKCFQLILIIEIGIGTLLAKE